MYALHISAFPMYESYMFLSLDPSSHSEGLIGIDSAVFKVY